MQGGWCIQDSDCIQPIQECNRSNPLKMHCEFVVSGDATYILLMNEAASAIAQGWW